MAKHISANVEREDVATANPLIMPQGYVKRMAEAISIGIGLYEIRVNLFLWDLFRLCKQKMNTTLENTSRS